MMGAKNLRQVLQKDPRKNCAYARGKIFLMFQIFGLPVKIFKLRAREKFNSPWRRRITSGQPWKEEFAKKSFLKNFPWQSSPSP